jgi:peptide/nickel transport system substrate-binding protein
VEITDSHTVVIRTAAPAPTLLPSLAVNEIVPNEYVAEVGDEAFAAEPIGTGPFTFSEWVANQRVVLESNPDHWNGAPQVGTVVFRPVPEIAARVAALQSGDVQIASEIPPDLAQTLSGDVEAAPVDGTRVFFLAMNTTQAPFDDADVRLGVNHAVDRDALVDDLLGGYARALNQPLFPEVIGYAEDFEGYQYEPDRAAAMLEGVDTPARIDVEERDRTLAEAVAGQLQAAGLDAQVNVLEAEAFTATTESGDSQAYIQSWGVAEGDADVIFARHFWSPSREDAFYTGYENPELDQLIEAGRSTLDADEREQIYADAVATVMADAPWAPLLNAQEIYGVSQRVEGFEPSPIGRYELAGVSLGS